MTPPAPIPRAQAEKPLLKYSIEDTVGQEQDPRQDNVRPKIVVRLSRSYWHDHDGAYENITIRYLKRQTKGFNMFDDDCSSIGASEVIPKIRNLSKCKPGPYRLVTCDGFVDFETGCVEDWDYKLVPLEPKAAPQEDAKS